MNFDCSILEIFFEMPICNQTVVRCSEKLLLTYNFYHYKCFLLFLFRLIVSFIIEFTKHSFSLQAFKNTMQTRSAKSCFLFHFVIFIKVSNLCLLNQYIAEEADWRSLYQLLLPFKIDRTPFVSFLKIEAFKIRENTLILNY